MLKTYQYRSKINLASRTCRCCIQTHWYPECLKCCLHLLLLLLCCCFFVLFCLFVFSAEITYYFRQLEFENIGTKHDFLFILISVEPWGSVKTRAWKAWFFNNSRRAQQMLMYQKIMFDRYYCIKHFSFTRKLFGKFFFPVPKGMLTVNAICPPTLCIKSDKSQ